MLVCQKPTPNPSGGGELFCVPTQGIRSACKSTCTSMRNSLSFPRPSSLDRLDAMSWMVPLLGGVPKVGWVRLCNGLLMHHTRSTGNALVRPAGRDPPFAPAVIMWLTRAFSTGGRGLPSLDKGPWMARATEDHQPLPISHQPLAINHSPFPLIRGFLESVGPTSFA